jgi:hypothetical protein
MKFYSSVSSAFVIGLLLNQSSTDAMIINHRVAADMQKEGEPPKTREERTAEAKEE